MIASEPSARAFPDLDEFLLGPTDLEAMPFEFGCDFASAFVEVDGTGASSSTSNAAPSDALKSRDAKRGIKRKSDASASSPFVLSSSSSSSSASLLAPHGHAVDAATAHGSTQIGRWTKKEHELFLEGLRLYGKSWKKISSLVVTRTLVQIRTHAQKYLQKQTKSAMKAAAAVAKTRSEYDDEDAMPLAQWKQQHSLFRPIAFPGSSVGSSSSSSSSHQHHHHSSLSSSTSNPAVPSSSSSSSFPSSSSAHRKEGSMSKLDQLLHDEASHEYYTSPTGSDDDLAQWLQHRHLPLLSTSSPAATKRRRTEPPASWGMVNPMEAALPSFFSQHQSQHHPSQSHSASSHVTEAGEFAFTHTWM